MGDFGDYSGLILNRNELTKSANFHVVHGSSTRLGFLLKIKIDVSYLFCVAFKYLIENAFDQHIPASVMTARTP